MVSLFFGLTFFYGRQIWAGIRHVEVAITVAVVLAIVVGIVVFLAHRRGKEMLRQENSDEEQVAISGDSKPAETSASNELRNPGQGA